MTDTSIERLFLTSSDPNRITYQGHNLVRIDRFPVRKGEQIRICLEQAEGNWRQGIRVKSDAPLQVDGVKSKDVILWADNMPPEVICTCTTEKGEVVIYNAWDSGNGVIGAWTGNAAMIVEEVPEGRRYRCTDGKQEVNFDDLVFRIERVGG